SKRRSTSRLGRVHTHSSGSILISDTPFSHIFLQLPSLPSHSDIPRQAHTHTHTPNIQSNVDIAIRRGAMLHTSSHTHTCANTHALAHTIYHDPHKSALSVRHTELSLTHVPHRHTQTCTHTHT